MPKDVKKRLRKIKDRLAHCANDLYRELESGDIQGGMLDEGIRSHRLLKDALDALNLAIHS